MSALRWIAVAAALAGCRDTGASNETRADIVTGSATKVASAPAASASAGATEVRHGKLCPTSARVSKDAPKVKLDVIDASTPTMGESNLETGGTWTWVNVWAGWCAPCRAEIPLLMRFRDRLAKEGTPARVTFVSIDDDDREARKFIVDSGMKESLYLGNAKNRTAFLSALGVGDATSLPMQVFIDPKGSIRCVAQGEVNEADYAEIAALVGKKD